MRSWDKRTPPRTGIVLELHALVFEVLRFGVNVNAAERGAFAAVVCNALLARRRVQRLVSELLGLVERDDHRCRAHDFNVSTLLL